MKLTEWLIRNDTISLLRLNSGLPLHPDFVKIASLVVMSGWIIDIDMKSSCGAWVCLRGLFAGKGYCKSGADLDSVIQIIGNDRKSFLEISPSDSIDPITLKDLKMLGFSEENNCGLMVMRWYKK